MVYHEGSLLTVWMLLNHYNEDFTAYKCFKLYVYSLLPTANAASPSFGLIAHVFMIVRESTILYK